VNIERVLRFPLQMFHDSSAGARMKEETSSINSTSGLCASHLLDWEGSKCIDVSGARKLKSRSG
jgi:hypothetical protein